MCVVVALRKESVDRNFDIDYYKTREHRSLSARRAWIEIYFLNSSKLQRSVALRKESVDRNRKLLYPGATRKMSLSARRAWIEMRLAEKL